jgi:hypothetical protein
MAVRGGCLDRVPRYWDHARPNVEETMRPRDISTISRFMMERHSRIYWRWPFTILLVLIGGIIAVLSPNQLADYARGVYLAQVIYIVVFSVIIIRVHFIIWRALRGSEMASIIPRHVIHIAGSYILANVGLAIYVVRHMGEEIDPIVFPIAMVAATWGALALGFVWRMQFAKYDAAPHKHRISKDVK